MRPHPQPETHQTDLFRSELKNIINMYHELVRLSELIDWNYLLEQNPAYYHADGRPGVDGRLMIGLHLLKCTYNLSDENVCERWICDPYFQYFCGEKYFQHALSLEHHR